jgi:hypothetical protein
VRVIAALACVGLWTIVALCVAFPDEATKLDYESLTVQFINGKERTFLPLLVVVDLIIETVNTGAPFGWEFPSSRKAHIAACILSLVAVAIYILIAGLYAIYQTQDAAKYAMHLSSVCFICLGVPRFIAYLKPDRPFGPLGR